MKLTDHITIFAPNASLFMVLLTTPFLSHPVSALTIKNPDGDTASFKEFVKQVQDGETNVLRGVYVPDVLAMPVRQQPANDPNFVSGKDGEVTQFSTASYYGNVGLLAHNNLSGKFFLQLAVGQEVRLVFGDGKVEDFVVTQILHFQALQPKSSWSLFRDLDGLEFLSAWQLFKRVYAGNRHVTFQTCIEVNGEENWGRLFIIAMPLSQ